MSYKVTFRDRTSTVVSTDKGERLMELLEKASPSEPIFIDGEMYVRSEIVSVKVAVGGRDIQPVVITEAPQLQAGQKCQGKASIQAAIHKIIVNKYGKDWPAKSRDKKLREELRRSLLDTGKPYCDSKAGVCVCGSYAGSEDDSQDVAKMTKEVADLMGSWYGQKD